MQQAIQQTKIPNKAISLKVTLMVALGSALEYYDFIIYGMLAKYLSFIFFPVNDNFSTNIQTFSVFAMGYLARPLGGTVIGMISDIYGRKKAFLLIMLMMAFSTFAIGLLPTYNTYGIISPILLILCRLVQGISFGAELPGASVIVNEFSQNNGIKGRLFSILLSSTSLGSLVALLVLTVLTQNFSDIEIKNGLWRLPFLLGGGLAIISFYIRKQISETPEFLLIQAQVKTEKQ